MSEKEGERESKVQFDIGDTRTSEDVVLMGRWDGKMERERVDKERSEQREE